MIRTARTAALICCSTLLTFGAAPTQAASFTFSNSSCASFSVTGGNGNFTLNCDGQTTTPPPAGVPTGCSVSANTNTLPIGGGAVSLTASCTGAAATNYTWAAPATGNPNNSTLATANIASTTTFSVVPSNASGAANAKPRAIVNALIIELSSRD